MKIPKKVNIHIIIMSVIGIIMSLAGLLAIRNPIAFLMLGVLPMVSIILFWVNKHPAFGIIYTVLFFINRAEVLLVGTLLARLMIVAMLAYFVYVICISVKAR